MNEQEIKSMQAYARAAFGTPAEDVPQDEPANESTRLAIVGLNIFEAQRQTLEAELRDVIIERDVIDADRKRLQAEITALQAQVAHFDVNYTKLRDTYRERNIEIRGDNLKWEMLHARIGELLLPLRQDTEVKVTDTLSRVIAENETMQARVRELEAVLKGVELERDARGNILNHAIEVAESVGIHTGNSWYQAIDRMFDTITALQARVKLLEDTLRPFALAARNAAVRNTPDVFALITTWNEEKIVLDNQRTVLSVYHLNAAADAALPDTDAGSNPA